MVNYANGPLDLTADYETVRGVNTTAFKAATVTSVLVPVAPTGLAIPVTTGVAASGGDVDVRVMTLGGSYDFGVVKLSALYDTHKVDANGKNTVDYRDYFISAKAPISGTKFTVKTTYGKVDDRTVADADATKFGLGLDYSLSKRTVIYADYGQISNRNQATYQVSAAANANGNNGVRGFDLGVAHTF
jgi:predicted porin